MAWLINPKNDIENLESNKVDKVTGKALSTNDYTTAEKTKLTNIEAEANKYTHPENHPASIINQDANNRFVTDTEKLTWNGKANIVNYQATILKSAWIGSEAPYSQVIAVGGILETDRPSIDVDLASASDYSEILNLLDEWGQVFRVTTQTGEITVFSQSITENIPITLKVIR